MSRADTSAMLETPVAVVVLAVWTFRRRDDVLALSREQTDEGYQLVVMDCGHPRTFGFRNLERLIHFQHDMEAFLVRTGWRLADFTPDRRGGDDRRDLPREDNDRRRWWTDVVRGRRLAPEGASAGANDSSQPGAVTMASTGNAPRDSRCHRR